MNEHTINEELMFQITKICLPVNVQIKIVGCFSILTDRNHVGLYLEGVYRCNHSNSVFLRCGFLYLIGFEQCQYQRNVLKPPAKKDKNINEIHIIKN